MNMFAPSTSPTREALKQFNKTDKPWSLNQLFLFFEGFVQIHICRDEQKELLWLELRRFEFTNCFIKVEQLESDNYLCSSLSRNLELYMAIASWYLVFVPVFGWQL